MAINAANYDLNAGAIHPTNSNRYLTVMIADKSGEVTEGGPGGTSIDAFGRLRVSQPVTLFDSQHRLTQNNKWSSKSYGIGSTVIYVQNESSMHLSIGTTAGCYVYEESKRTFGYQPGKSFLSLSSFVMNTPKTNLRQRVGLYSTTNGIYLENDGSQSYIVRRSSVTGSVVEERIAQSNWNYDTFLGTGPSKVNLNVDKANILWLDVEWLGVGDVRVGFVNDGKFALAHTFRHANDQPTSYMTTVTLPLRVEVEATGTVVGISTFTQICNTVISEGGYNPISERYSAGINASTVTLTNPGAAYKYITSIRLAPGYTDSVVKIAGISGATSDNTKTAHIKVLKNATISGGSWVNETTRVQYNNSATFSGGTVVGDAFLAGGGSINFGNSDTFELYLGRDINATSDTFTLVGQGLQNNVDFGGNIQWFELV